MPRFLRCLPRSLAISGLSCSCWSWGAIASPLPIERQGSCPLGYYASGSYCVPGRQARPAVLKLGNCPVGWYASGNYCLASQTARPVIPKLGSCPIGSYANGNYCVLTR
ncbi:hypothetical protein [Synechococcus elongatus]|uniref:Lipoprotein n=1 Tax=Synechococcus sp. (strain ATCC 27144 / PCC 6301 / SAUG 1402/1) TaxID=269084 RepID=A0A0H3K0B5_SYNP6|nr:hypothetical protein [Synechococcus elongatus]MBD2688706.1 hypothetical protein [Synechococcus elongatus FACHB-1061]AJD58369.1 hypothetical protein M744_11245 [Synechococcus elongatus UTEX 2973]MBD2587515.1 hypothetical protein [Synechococcus elongatus FACHB-242]MBD2707777.1 hypothetical protein [Synechococcus elongatus PCC 7942 = FACHB-805]UOW70893.1 hypothetical protein PCC7943_1136 [Synechococcus elongatus PCC 7943]